MKVFYIPLICFNYNPDFALRYPIIWPISHISVPNSWWLCFCLFLQSNFLITTSCASGQQTMNSIVSQFLRSTRRQSDTPAARISSRLPFPRHSPDVVPAGCLIGRLVDSIQDFHTGVPGIVCRTCMAVHNYLLCGDRQYLWHVCICVRARLDTCVCVLAWRWRDGCFFGDTRR